MKTMMFLAIIAMGYFVFYGPSVGHSQWYDGTVANVQFSDEHKCYLVHIVTNGDSEITLDVRVNARYRDQVQDIDGGEVHMLIDIEANKLAKILINKREWMKDGTWGIKP